MRKWKKIALEAVEANKNLCEELQGLREELKKEEGLCEAALNELERVRNEAKELAMQCGAALKELEMRSAMPRGENDLDRQWENMMSFTGAKQEGGIE